MMLFVVVELTFDVVGLSGNHVGVPDQRVMLELLFFLAAGVPTRHIQHRQLAHMLVVRRPRGSKYSEAISGSSRAIRMQGVQVLRGLFTEKKGDQ